MPWSLNKLDHFYNTDLGQQAKNIIQQNVCNKLNKMKMMNKYDSDSVMVLGYDLLDHKFPVSNTLQATDQQFNLIIACHCEEMQICFSELLTYCNAQLAENGICMFIVSNGNGFWHNSSTPFNKYRTYKSIKALKRLHFKILSKSAMLFFPLNLFQTRWKNTYNIWDKLCKYIIPSYGGAMLITVQKQTCINILQDKKSCMSICKPRAISY